MEEDGGIVREYLGGLDVVRLARKYHRTNRTISRAMGHSSVKVTEIYLQDFQSRHARLQHTKYSPVGDLKLPKPGRGGRMHAARGMSPSSGERRVGDDEPGGSAIAR
jgi:hypothetical protein